MISENNKVDWARPMVQFGQIRLLYDQATTGLAVTLCAVLVLGTFLLIEGASVAVIGGWWSATVLIIVGRWWLIRQFRTASDAHSNPAFWCRCFVVGSTLAGLTWGIGGVVAASEVSLPNQALILIVIGGMIAGGFLILGSVVSAFVGFMLGATVPSLLWMLWQGDHIYLVVSVLVIVFATGAWLAVLNFSRNLSKALYLKSKSIALVTELRTANEKLKHRDSMLQIAAQTARLGYWHFDEVANEYLSVSDEYADIFGYTAEEFLNKYRTLEQDMNLVFPADREKLLEGYAAGSGVELDYRIFFKDGTLRYVREISNHIHDEAGNLIEATGTLLDITNIKELQHQAEQASLAKSEFLSRMSHELRTPMNAVLGFSQLLEAEATLSDNHKEYVDYILSAGNHLMTLINEVLELEQVDSGRIELVIEAVNLDEIVQECIRLVQSLADKHQVRIESQVTANGFPVIQADKIRLKQVLLNLMSNGIKYNREGGSMTVSCEDRETGMLRINVSDTGLGFAEDRKGELFEPFSRLGIEKSGIQGTGIGLTITKRLVTLMGGEMGAESTLNEGSKFWVELGLERIGEVEAEVVHDTG